MAEESPLNRYDSSSDNNENQRGKNQNSSSSSRSRDSSRSSEKVKKSSRRKSNSSSRSLSQEDENKKKKKVFDYELFLEHDQILALTNKIGEQFNSLYNEFKLQNIAFDKSIQIPDMQGQCLKITDDSREVKYSVVQSILKHIVESTTRNSISIIVLIPEGMVSLLIGKQGRQIKKIMDDSRAKVVANQPITGMNQRTIGITGHYSDVSKAIDIIYDIMQERSAIVYDIEKIPNKVPVEKLIVRARFVFSYNLKSYLQHQKSKTGKSLLTHIDYKMDTTTSFLVERQPYVQRDEFICQIKGKLEPVQQTLCALFRKINEYYVHERSKPDYKIKIVIPTSYVTKLIGKEGCMIRDLAARSGGAQIKILSHKGDERPQYECPIEIAGTLANKQDACCLIIEKIEQFKNGGPILRSGKAINENLVEQYKNSIQDNCIQHDQRFRQQLKELDDEFDRSRSRSHRGRRFSNHMGGGGGGGASPKGRYPNEQYYRSRSRSKEIHRKEYDRDRERERMDRERERMMERDRKDGRRGGDDRYEREMPRDSRMQHDKYYSRMDEKDRRGGGGGGMEPHRMDRERERERDRERSRDRKERRHSPSPRRQQGQRRWDEEPAQKLKIPIIVSTKLVQEFQYNNHKIVKMLQEQTGCKISIEKEKRLVLNGTVEQSTSAFKRIMQEFLKIGSE